MSDEQRGGESPWWGDPQEGAFFGKGAGQEDGPAPAKRDAEPPGEEDDEEFEAQSHPGGPGCIWPDDDEPCPFCGDPCNPGACVGCVHYIGSLVDSQYQWKGPGELAAQAWDALEQLLAECCGVEDRWALEEDEGLWKLAVPQLLLFAEAQGLASDFLAIEGLWMEREAHDAVLLSALLIQEGADRWAADSMTGGSEHALFIEDPTALDRLGARIGEFEAKLRKEFEAGRFRIGSGSE